MEMHTGMSDDETPLFDWPGPLGTWLDLADAHWLTTASLRSAASHHPEGDWDVRRFRPDRPHRRRQRWMARGRVEHRRDRTCRLRSHDADTSLHAAAARQPGLAVDRAIATTLRDVHDGNLGVYARITRPGTITVGDPVVTPP